MIVRVLRAELAPGRAGDFHSFIADTALPALLGCGGLVDVQVGLRSEGSQELGLIVTVWSDWAALEAAMGPDVTQPYQSEGLAGIVVEWSVEHYEGMAVPLDAGARAGSPVKPPAISGATS